MDLLPNHELGIPKAIIMVIHVAHNENVTTPFESNAILSINVSFKYTSRTLYRMAP
jgi:hypothetical protein